MLASIDAAAITGEDVRTGTVETANGTVPVRVLADRLDTRTGQPAFLQIARTASPSSRPSTR